MLPISDYSKIIFIDIETVPVVYNFNELDSRGQELWNKKTRFLQEREEKTAEEIYEKAGIYSEFAKVACISIGLIIEKGGEQQIRLKSFAHEDEKVLLQEFIDLLNSKFNSFDYMFCAHNGKEFDYPFMARRILINNLKLPTILNTAGKKPWEVKHLDTMELWKFGDYKHYTSLELLTYVFNIPTPKDDIDGSEVYRVYYKEQEIDRIITYCEKDTIAVAQILLRMNNEPILAEENIVKI